MQLWWARRECAKEKSPRRHGSEYKIPFKRKGVGNGVQDGGTMRFRFTFTEEENVIFGFEGYDGLLGLD